MLALVAFLCWYFMTIITFILIAAVISFLGRPISDLLGRFRIGGYLLPDAVRAGLTLACIWTVFFLFAFTVIPLVAREFYALSSLNIESVFNQLASPLFTLEESLKEYGLMDPDGDIRASLIASFRDLVDVSHIKSLFGSLAGTVSGIFIALFSITFISFFFIKDSKLFTRIILATIPTRYEEGAKNALESIRHLLVRYFVGIFAEMLVVMLLNTMGLSIIGIAFSHAVLIGLISGIVNIIPYLGPFIGIVFGLSVGVVVHLEADFYTMMLPMLIGMGIVMLITQLIDNIVLQPLIYGNSVYAHPLEIFLVILIAGNLAGIPGMILAIPTYTVLRVVLREFFNKYKLVKSLTHSLDSQERRE